MTYFDHNIPDVTCDESKIMQVFLNIIKNATESMHESEQKEEPAKLVFKVQAITDMVQIEIEDNGPGMDEKVRKRIFEPFFTTKETGKGTGLGLSSSYFIIVKDHRGEMEVESISGIGTRFIIRLPL